MQECLSVTGAAGRLCSLQGVWWCLVVGLSLSHFEFVWGHGVRAVPLSFHICSYKITQLPRRLSIMEQPPRYARIIAQVPTCTRRPRVVAPGLAWRRSRGNHRRPAVGHIQRDTRRPCPECAPPPPPRPASARGRGASQGKRKLRSRRAGGGASGAQAKEPAPEAGARAGLGGAWGPGRVTDGPRQEPAPSRSIAGAGRARRREGARDSRAGPRRAQLRRPRPGRRPRSWAVSGRARARGGKGAAPAEGGTSAAGPEPGRGAGRGSGTRAPGGAGGGGGDSPGARPRRAPLRRARPGCPPRRPASQLHLAGPRLWAGGPRPAPARGNAGAPRPLFRLWDPSRSFVLGPGLPQAGTSGKNSALDQRRGLRRARNFRWSFTAQLGSDQGLSEPLPHLPRPSFCFLGPHPRHREVPRLGVKWELQRLAYTTGTAASAIYTTAYRNPRSCTY